MPTLIEYVGEIFKRDPQIGRRYPAASFTTTTAVVTQLNTGVLSSNTRRNQYITRRSTATQADRVRLVSSFASASGTFTHDGGTNYVGTVAGDIDITSFDPYDIDIAVNMAIQQMRRLDRYVIPTRMSVSRYWLNDLTWLEDANGVIKVGLSHNPIQNDNRSLEKWNTIDTSGVLKADGYTLAGSGATATRSTTQNERGQYTTALTRAGTDLTYTRTIGLLDNGVAGDSLQGETVTVAGRMWASGASSGRFSIYDGVTTSTTDYHTGGSIWEELTKEITLSASATTLEIAVQVNDNNETVYVDDHYSSEQFDDSTRRDAYPEHPLADSEWRVDQGNGTYSVFLPIQSRRSQYLIYTERPYPGFDNTRLLAGTADGDSNDAPLIPVAVGAIANLYENLSMHRTENTAKYAGLATEWRQKFDTLQQAHLGAIGADRGGLDLPRAMVGGRPF